MSRTRKSPTEQEPWLYPSHSALYFFPVVLTHISITSSREMKKAGVSSDLETSQRPHTYSRHFLKGDLLRISLFWTWTHSEPRPPWENCWAYTNQEVRNTLQVWKSCTLLADNYILHRIPVWCMLSALWLISHEMISQSKSYLCPSKLAELCQQQQEQDKVS